MMLGADGIKLFTVPITQRQPFPVLPIEIVRAASDETHRSRRLVFVHPTNLAGAEVAVAGGVDILAHTLPSAGSLPDSLLRDMQHRGIALIPTLTLWEDDYGSDTTGMRAFVRAGQEQVRAFVNRGGRILFGTDVGYIPRYDPTREYELMANAGLDFAAILASLTIAPADEFGFSARAGRIARGLALGVTGLYSLILSTRALWSLRQRQPGSPTPEPGTGPALIGQMPTGLPSRSLRGYFRDSASRSLRAVPFPAPSSRVLFLNAAAMGSSGRCGAWCAAG